ncbi:MAG: type 1 glutamine amidotransferase [Deltaproteobacteria bacterium]|nr:type 1 glutamine amidotransferase [Deltaproteobacteria bacterium]
MTARRLLVVDNALDHGFYRPLEHWAAAAGGSGLQLDSVHPPSGEHLPRAGLHSHVILTGCEGSIVKRPAWAEREASWVAECVRAGCRVLGSCWGHQLIAVALAGPASVRRCARPEFGWLRIEVADGGGLLEEGFSAFVSHFDEVIPGCSEALRVLASTADCAVHAFRWADLPVWGIQAHPEVGVADGRAFLAGALERWPEHAALSERGLAAEPADSRIAPALVDRFLQY